VTTILTVGHGTLPAERFVELLQGAGIQQVVDVRSFPGSRRNPQYGRAAMEQWLPTADVEYRWLAQLGGRRRPVDGSKHVALRHPSFRAYADHMESKDFQRGVSELLDGAGGTLLAVMCSETVWWRCHRRLLADHLLLVREVEVLHLMHDGRLTPHRPTHGVRRKGRRLVYDVDTAPPLREEGSGG
jgi:uncharacterized protein (DUF488 family)